MIKKIVGDADCIKETMRYLQLWTGLFVALFTSLLGWIFSNTHSPFLKQAIMIDVVLVLFVIVFIILFFFMTRKLYDFNKQNKDKS